MEIGEISEGKGRREGEDQRGIAGRWGPNRRTRKINPISGSATGRGGSAKRLPCGRLRPHTSAARVARGRAGPELRQLRVCQAAKPSNTAFSIIGRQIDADSRRFLDIGPRTRPLLRRPGIAFVELRDVCGHVYFRINSFAPMNAFVTSL
jgi:hypothetical protein